jgi:phosphate transport system permease protein
MTSTVPRSRPANPTSIEAEHRSEERLRLKRVSAQGTLALVGSALASLGLVWTLYERVLTMSGALGFWLCCYGAFLGLYASVCGSIWNRQIVTDKVVTVAVTSAGLLVIGVLFDQIGYLTFRGAHAVVHSNFFTDTMAHAGPLAPLSQGGALHAMVGSLEQLSVATLLAVPLGILAALYMAEVGGRMVKPVRTLVDAMTALPSIVAGLFILSLVVVTLGYNRSGLAASLAITIMMMPIVTRAAEIVIRLVPNTLREAAYALGAPQWRVALTVVLPTARSGLTTAIVLAMARGVGETSPVLLTAGFTKEMSADPSRGPQTNLPVYIWTYVRFPQPNMVARGFGAGLTLLLVVLVLFITARVLGGRAPGEPSRRQRRRAARGATSLRKGSSR